MKIPCEFCNEPIDPRGMTSHVHFRHRAEVLAKFRSSPLVSAALACANIAVAIAGAAPKQLSAAPPELERALTYLAFEEDKLADDLLTRGVTAADIAAGNVPADLVQRVRLLTRAINEVGGFPVWSVAIWQRVDR